MDASRARRSRPLTAHGHPGLHGRIHLVGRREQPGHLPQPDGEARASLRQQQIARLQSFAQAKEKQSRELAAKAGEQITPEFQRFFDAATRGDWQTVTNRFAYFKQHHPQYEHGTNATI